MKTYRQQDHSRSETVDAIRFDGTNSGRIERWCIEDGAHVTGFLRTVAIKREEGTQTVRIGDWIVRLAEADFIRVANSIFTETYEEIE